MKMRTYPDALGAPMGSRKLIGATLRGASLRTGPPLVLPIGACLLGTLVAVAVGCLPLAAVDAVLAALLEVAAEDEPVVEARLVGTFGGLECVAASESPTFEMLSSSSSSHSAKNCSKEGSGVPP